MREENKGGRDRLSKAGECEEPWRVDRETNKRERGRRRKKG